MLCPKCGQEYEGNACPRCQGPEIIVNNTEYLKRRKAYEEKQAASESASSDTAPLQEEAAEEILKKIKEQGTKLLEKKRKAKTAPDQMQGRRKKQVVRLAAGLVLLAVVLAAGIGIYKLSQRKNFVLYMQYNGKIYNVAGLESELVCESDKAIFEADNAAFYTPQVPEPIASGNVLQTLASDGGKYFSAVTYDDAVGKYMLYLWNDKGYIKIAEDAKEKEVQYITDRGSVIYTDAAVVNSEGAVSGVELMMYSAEKGSSIFEKGVLTVLESDLKSAYIYAQKDTIIILGNSDILYTYHYGKENTKKRIADQVESIYAMSDVMDDVYTYRAHTVNKSDGADGLIYRMDGTCYYHEITDKPEQDIVLGKAGASGMEFVYDKNAYLYRIYSGVVEGAKIKKAETPVYTVLDTLGTDSDIVYLSSQQQLLFINAAGQLVKAEQGKLSVAAEEMAAGSLSLVSNTQQAVTYIRNGVQYYRSKISGKEVRMTEVGDGAVTDDTIYYKNRLYFYNTDGKLYSCTVKGKDDNLVGEVDRFWLGTEYR